MCFPSAYVTYERQYSETWLIQNLKDKKKGFWIMNNLYYSNNKKR
jgi:hypothetical protein